MIRHFILALGLAMAVSPFLAPGASACEDYKVIDNTQLKEFRDKLLEAEADPLDRLFAFQELVCSDNPTIRTYAVREGLRASRDPLVRQQIMFDAMMGKTRLDIELTATVDATQKDKQFIKENAGVWSAPVAYVSAQEGCMSLYQSNTCSKGLSVYVRGDAVEIGYNRLIGDFRLADDNKLVGFIRVSGTSDYGRIPATIALF